MLRATITIVHKYLSAICDNPRKVDAKGHHHLLKSNKPHCPQFVTTPQRWMLRATITIVHKYLSAICDNPRKVDAKGHHHLLKSNKPHCPQFVTTPRKWMLRATIRFCKVRNFIVQKYGCIICGNSTKVDAKGHHQWLQSAVLMCIGVSHCSSTFALIEVQKGSVRFHQVGATPHSCLERCSAKPFHIWTC